MNLSTGQRISVRGEEFLVSDAVENLNGSFIVRAEGVSELVKGRRFIFDTAIDTDIAPVDPRNTDLVADTDAGYRKTKLYLETQLRNAPRSSERITIAHKAAIDLADYQLTPTLKALRLPRPRILIADGVGLGKTIQTGIFLAEMIRRGRGKRIMVLAPRSILTQYQQEIWHRFTIPLVRLDSEGIDRIRTRLPLNKNPFDYFDKTIVSIDTLKNNAKFRLHLEKSTWDIVVIDECHTIANDGSLRGALAQLMASRCESLILTSATPHNGRRENFANLIEMIDPVAIPRNRPYEKRDVEPYYVRRFKHDIREDAVLDNFRDREVIRHSAKLGPLETAFLTELQSIRFRGIQAFRSGGDREDYLFAIGIFKAFMSSPRAACASLQHRIERLSQLSDRADEVGTLRQLLTSASAILEGGHDSKYRSFRDTLVGLQWRGRPRDPRFVVFTERIDTIRYLEARLQADFDLKPGALRIFHGSLTDTEQQQLIEDFGKADSDIRLLICSDAGSQGVNLHFFCNRMFNYDIPWSLITLEQRNGRIDRYGQRETPYIHYIISESDTEGLRTDLHIIERLTEKEEEVYRTLGDAGSVMRLYDARQEERFVEDALFRQDEDFLIDNTTDDSFDFSLLFEEGDATDPIVTEDPIDPPVTVFPDDGSFYRALFEQLRSDRQIDPDQVEIHDDGYIEIVNDAELDRILFDLPPEAKPPIRQLYRLTLDKTRVQRAIEEARKRRGEWAAFQMMWDLHPIIRHHMTKLEAGVPKGRALTARLSKLPPGTAWYILHAQVSNNLGQPVVSEFFATALRMDGRIHTRTMPLNTFIETYGINAPLINEAIPEEHLAQLRAMIPDMLDLADSYMIERCGRRATELRQRLADHDLRLQEWHLAARTRAEAEYAERGEGHFWRSRFEKTLQDIEAIRQRASQYQTDLNSLRGDPYHRILAVFYHND
jgi:superfamily II DNA or RNA helicase